MAVTSTASDKSIDAAFVNYISKRVFPEEGAYSNDPNDAGGETMWGITEAVAREMSYVDPMRLMTQMQALDIYRRHDWIKPGFVNVASIDLPLAMVLLDLGINVGDSWPGRWMQRALNVLNYTGLYPSMTVDGAIGPGTLAALKAFVGERGTEGLRVMKAMVRAQAGVRYIEIAEANPKDKEYEFGWLSKRAFPFTS